MVVGKETSFFQTYYLLHYYLLLLLLLLLLLATQACVPALVTASQLALVATKEEGSVWPKAGAIWCSPQGAADS